MITPSFTLQGGFDLTPSSPATLTVDIPRAVPQLLSGSVTARTLNSFTVTLNGISTSRALRQLDIQITPKSGESIQAAHLAVDIASSATSWFQSSTSQAFGGTFLVSIPFVLQNGSSTDDLVQRLQSVSITATNDTGSSTALIVPIP